MTSPVSAIEAIEKAMRDHTKVDATGLSPAVASAYVVGFDEAAKAISEIAARQAEALQRRAEEAEALAERLKLEAQSHAQEARTANSTIYEIYQVVSGGKGEPGNWRGAEPVHEKLEALQRENAGLKTVTESGQAFANQVRSITYELNGQAYSSTVSALNKFDADLRRARALLGGENAE